MNWMTVLRIIGPTVVTVILPKITEWLQQLILDAIAESEMNGGTSEQKLQRAVHIVKSNAPQYTESQIENAISAAVDATNKVHEYSGDTKE